MIEVRRLESQHWELLRELRLNALLDAPSAFGSNHERESALTDEHWIGRFSTAAWFAAFDGATPLGLVAARPSPQDTANERELISLWVAPAGRGRGVAAALVAAVVREAAELDATAVGLRLYDGNDPARKLYERLGFFATGEVELHEDHPVGRREWMRLKSDSFKTASGQPA